MGAELSKVFVDVSNIPHTFGGFVQLLFLGAVYGYILMFASNMIKDGSELLLLVPALAGVVGSIVLPVLGAVPDGAIVIFSGLGDDAQQQVSVGVGALAGSTIMLLTVPWTLAIIAGRVNVENGKAHYARPSNWPKGVRWTKLSPPGQLRGTGVYCGPSIKKSAIMMLITTIPYLIIQIPAAAHRCTMENEEKHCHTPKWASLLGGILAALLFVVYLIYQAKTANADPVKEDLIDELRKRAVRDHLVSIRGLFPDKFVDHEGEVPVTADNKRFQSCVRPFFRQFDRDNSGTIDKEEFTEVLHSLGESPSKKQVDDLMKEVDTNNDGVICFDEFVQCVVRIISDEDFCTRTRTESKTEELRTAASRTGDSEAVPLLSAGSVQQQRKSQEDAPVAVRSGDAVETDAAEGEGEGDEEDEEELQMPEDLAHLSPAEQQKRILMRSCFLMFIGVAIVLIFSDPMVDVLSELGNHSGIPPFFIAFVCSPLASNASELIAAYYYALKKTEKTVTISFASLIGAACMNNTFCLSLFLFLIYCRDLQWEFSAETIAILVVEVFMFIMAVRRLHHWWYSFVVLAAFPLSIALVIALEKAGLN